MKLFNLTTKFSATPASIDVPPPTLGQHQEEILGLLWYCKEDLKDKRAI